MKLAYLMLVHKNLSQVARLINILADDKVSFFVHIDQKCVFSEDEFSQLLVDNADVYLLEPRSSANWGGFSLVEITYRLLKCCAMSNGYDYIHLISGQDFPLVATNVQRKFLKDHLTSEFVECFPLPDERRWRGYFGAPRFEQYWFIDQMGYEESVMSVNRQMIEEVRRKLPFNLKPYGGSQWFTITWACMEYILQYLKDFPEVLDYFRYCLAPDEMLFQTIIMNSPFSKNLINNNLRKIDWYAGANPKIFGLRDLNYLLDSGRLFARKFDLEMDEQILSSLEQRIKIPRDIL